MHMKILHLLSTIDPRAGGPTEGVRQSGISMQSMGHEVEVVTLDDPAAPWLAAFPLTVHALGPSKGNYGLCPQLVPWLREHAARFDAVIVNGLWQYHGFARVEGAARQRRALLRVPARHARPVVQARLSAQASEEMAVLAVGGISRAARCRSACSSPREEERVLRAAIVLALSRATRKSCAYGTNPPPLDADAAARSVPCGVSRLRGKRLMLFLGRIHEKKGCDLLIKAFAPCRDRDANAASRDGRSRRRRMGRAAAGPRARTGHRGSHHLDRHAAAATSSGARSMRATRSCCRRIRRTSASRWPRRSAARLPVLISDKVNIWREIEADGAGIVGTDTVDGTDGMLRRWLTLPPPTPRRCARRRSRRSRSASPSMRCRAMTAPLDNGASHRNSAFGKRPRTASL